MRSYSMYLALKNGYCIGTEPMRMYYAWYMEPYAIQNSRLKALREAMFFFQWFSGLGFLGVKLRRRLWIGILAFN